MKAKLTATVIVVCFLLAPQAQSQNKYICYPMIHAQVQCSLEEHDRQLNIKYNQATVGVEEAVNKEELNSFQKTYQKVKSRLNSLGLIIEGGKFIMETIPLFNSIKKTQSEIFDLVADHPKFIPFAVQSEVEFVDKANSVIRLITGLVLSIGDLNQMEASDRKILLDFAVDELRMLDGQSFILRSSLQRKIMTESLAIAAFADWINQDKRIIDEIMSNIKNF